MVDIEILTPEREKIFITEFQKNFVRRGEIPPSRQSISRALHHTSMFQEPETGGETIFITPESSREITKRGYGVAETLSHEELHRVLDRIHRKASTDLDRLTAKYQYGEFPHSTGLSRPLVRALEAGKES